MAFPSPKKPDANFPPKAVTKIYKSPSGISKEQDCKITLPVLVTMVVAALKTLKNIQGSTMTNVRKLLISEGFITESTDLRPAFIQALRKGIINRPLSAVKAGIYGRYITTIECESLNLKALKKSPKDAIRRRKKPGKANHPKYRSSV